MTENTISIEDRFIRADEVRYLLGNLSKTTFHRLRTRGVIPEPVRLGANVYWPYREIEELIRNLSNSRAKPASLANTALLEPNTQRQRKPGLMTLHKEQKEAA